MDRRAELAEVAAAQRAILADEIDAAAAVLAEGHAVRYAVRAGVVAVCTTTEQVRAAQRAAGGW